MNLPKILFLSITSLIFFFQETYPFQHQDKNGFWEKSLNGYWKFRLNGEYPDFHKTDFDDSQWQEIRVPGNWEMFGFEEPYYQEPTESVGFYRSRFVLPENWKDRQIVIRFEGVLFGFEFWVNGKLVGTFESAFNRSEFNITSHVRMKEENILAVKVYKRFKGYEFDTNDAWALSGIFRDVQLLALPNLHIEDITLTSNLNNDLSIARLTCKLTFGYFKNESSIENIEIHATLFDQKQIVTGKFSRSAEVSHGKIMTISGDISVKNPACWSAESPALYILQIDLMRGDLILQSVIQRVGLRQVTIDGDILKLNGRQIKLRGVNRHEIHPDFGRALREAQWREDLELMKQANINTIRTSHYPPHHRLLDLCDEYGFYVICEVPFGYGDKHLDDPSYQDILYNRAEATVLRDKNHPSVIIWSVGNENPCTDLVVNTVKKVKEMDGTRPVLLPMAEEGLLELPEVVDILALHYPYADKAEGQKKHHSLTGLATTPEITRPIISTENSHSLGLAFEGLGRRWEVMQKYDRLAGGCIWLWADQGIRRQINGRKVYDSYSDPYVVPKKSALLSGNIWIDENTIIDSHGSWGTDGIVYADRRPQVDYWLTRKVYSPVKIMEKSATVQPGNQTLELKVENRYDFTNLKKLTGFWQLESAGIPISSGNILLDVEPHKRETLAIPLQLPTDIDQKQYLIKIFFKDFYHRAIYEHCVRLLSGGRRPEYRESQTGLIRPQLIAAKNGSEYLIDHPEFSLIVSDADGKMALSDSEGQNYLVYAAPILRVGRKPTMAERINYPKTGRTFWENYLLTEPRLVSSVMQKESDSVVLQTVYEYERTDSIENRQSIMAELNFTVEPEGWIDVDYTLKPVNCNDYFLTLGLGFLIPRDFIEFAWLGDGPFDSYPGKDEASEFGIYHLRNGDLYFPGNRANVDLATLTNFTGNGIGIMADSSNFCCEMTDQGMVISQNLLIAGKGNKPTGKITMHRLLANDIEQVSGHLKIFVLKEGKWPRLYKDLFSTKHIDAIDYRPQNF